MTDTYAASFVGGPLDGQVLSIAEPQELEEFTFTRKGGEELSRFAYRQTLAPNLEGAYPSGPFQFQYAGPVLPAEQAAAPTEAQSAGVMDPTAQTPDAETPAEGDAAETEQPATQPDALQPQVVEGPLSTVTDAASTPSGQAEQQTAGGTSLNFGESNQTTDALPPAPTEIPTSEPAPAEETAAEPASEEPASEEPAS
jgi:hypothetical protein